MNQIVERNELDQYKKLQRQADELKKKRAADLEKRRELALKKERSESTGHHVIDTFFGAIFCEPYLCPLAPIDNCRPQSTIICRKRIFFHLVDIIECPI
jgi:hypothetical protein